MGSFAFQELPSAEYEQIRERAIDLMRRGVPVGEVSQRCGMSSSLLCTLKKRYQLRDVRETYRTVYIYGLICPFARQIFYVGQSKDPWKRYHAHLHHPASPQMDLWLARLKSVDRNPKLAILDCIFPEESKRCEQEWIRRLYNGGHPLLNRECGEWRKKIDGTLYDNGSPEEHIAAALVGCGLAAAAKRRAEAGNA